jgi:prepilin-type N-terminal cleavage/methylation domain-containing protein
MSHHTWKRLNLRPLERVFLTTINLGELLMTLKTQKGFTLVELAIVMTIIGLLIGGILKGQELMQNARITATIAQVRAFEAATTTFRDKYDAVPGDMANATQRIPNCTVAACSNAAATGAGNGIVGDDAWFGAGTLATTPTPVQGTVHAAATAGVEADEPALFWTHLLKADLITGVTDAYVNGAPNGLIGGEVYPAAKSGQSLFVAGYGTGAGLPGSAADAMTGPVGLIVVLAPSAAAAGNVMTITASAQPLIPTRAAQIDRKMDDGKPGSGYVQAYGVSNSCYGNGAGAAAVGPLGLYTESVTTQDCGLAFRIQG